MLISNTQDGCHGKVRDPPVIFLDSCHPKQSSTTAAERLSALLPSHVFHPFGMLAPLVQQGLHASWGCPLIKHGMNGHSHFLSFVMFFFSLFFCIYHDRNYVPALKTMHKWAKYLQKTRCRALTELQVYKTIRLHLYFSGVACRPNVEGITDPATSSHWEFPPTQHTIASIL